MTAVTANTATVTAGNRWSPNRRRATACAITPNGTPAGTAGLAGADDGNMGRVRNNRICGIEVLWP